MQKKVISLVLALLLTITGLVRAEELTVNTGTITNAYVPVYGFYADAYLKAEFVTPAADLAGMADSDITSMRFQIDLPALEAWTGTFQVFLTEVDYTTMSAFQGSEGATIVYEGPLDGTGEQLVVDFTTPYTYHGGNLLIGVYQPTRGNYKSITFKGIDAPGASVQNYSYTSLEAITPIARDFLPQTTFVYEASAPAEHRLVALVNEEEVDALNVGTRPIGAWMEPFHFQLKSEGAAATVTNLDFTPQDGLFILGDIETPFLIGRDETVDLDISTNGVEAGVIERQFVTIYQEAGRTAAVWPVTVEFYVPEIPDLVEMPRPHEEITFPYVETVAGMHNDYTLPFPDIEEGNDAVFELVIDADAVLNARVSDGDNGKVALYTEDFNDEGGPMVNNNYAGPMPTTPENTEYTAGPVIENLPVVPGTYYLVASSTSDPFTVEINTEPMPCPEQAYGPTPDDDTDGLEPASVTLKWHLPDFATEYRLVFGSTYYPDPEHPQSVLVDWTRDLAESYTVTDLWNNTNYFWRVDVRNGSEGCETLGEIWGFTTHLNKPHDLVANDYTIFDDQEVTLSWTAIQDRTFRTYYIYRNGVKVGETNTNDMSATSHVDGPLEYNMDGYEYYVTAIYDEGESMPSNTITVQVSGYTNETGINGYVWEQDGETGIENAIVTLTGQDEFGDTQTYTATTDANGYYSKQVYAGTYNNAVASKEGYQDVVTVHPLPFTVAYNAQVDSVNFIMDENFDPVCTVIAEYYPDSLDPESPYVKVYWGCGLPGEEIIEPFETGDFSLFDWQIDANYPWSITTTDPYEGTYCMKSGGAGVNSVISNMTVTVNIPADGEMSFFGKISSEQSWDYGYFFIDGTQMGSYTGAGNWGERKFPITAGDHTFQWQYTKDGSVNNNDDCFYVDYITFYRQPEPVGAGWHTYLEGEFNDALRSNLTDQPAFGYHYPTSITGQYNGFLLTKVSMFSDDLYGAVGGNYTCNIYQGGDTPGAGTLVSTQTVDLPVGLGEWVDWDLDTPVTVNGSQDLWVIWQVNVAGGLGYPAGMCNSDNNPNGDWWNAGEGWENYGGGVWTMRNYFTDRSGRSVVLGSAKTTLNAPLAMGQDAKIDSRLRSFIKSDNRVTAESINPNASSKPLVMAGSNRALSHYRVYRTNCYNDGPYTEENTVLLATVWVPDTVYIDVDWPDAAPGVYKWGVGTVYAGNRGEEIAGPIHWSEPININNDKATRTDYTYGFESDLEGWMVIDVNAGEGTWLHSSVNPGGYDYTAHAHDGTGFAMCYSYIDYVGSYNTDSYLVSPQKYSIENGSSITFYADNANDTYPENFSVCVATTSDVPMASDFTSVWSGAAKGNSSAKANVRHDNNRYDNWREHSIDLSAYAGQEVWIAFHDVNYDQYEIWIDDVTIVAGNGTGPTPPTPSGNNLNQLALPRESETIWSNCLEKSMYLGDGLVDINVLLNSADSPEGIEVSFVNLNENEQANNPMASITLDETGFYSWDSFRKGDYLVKIDFDGYYPIEDTVHIWDETHMRYVMTEIIYGVDNLYVSRTGWAMWEPNGTPGEGDRHLEYFKVMCTSIDGEPIFNADTEHPFCQVDTDELVEGEHYICKVAAIYSTGMSDWTECVWQYESCEHYNGTFNGVTVNGNTISWDYPTGTGPVPPPQPGENALVVLNVPTDIWGDGSGYQMLLDADATMYTQLAAAMYFDEIGSFDGFEYTIPENADYGINPANIVVNNSVAIEIPAGTYDYAIINPDKVSTIWFAGNSGNAESKGDDMVYEAGKMYTYTLSSSGTGDMINLTITDRNGMVSVPTGENVATLASAIRTANNLANRDGDWYYYDNGVNVDGIGTGGGQFYWAVMFPAGSYTGNTVTKVSAYDYMAMTGNVTIYNDGATAPANQVGQMDVTFTGAEDFVEFTFAEPVTIDPTKNVWVVFFNESGATYPAACCDNTGDANGRWVSMDGVDWMDILEAAPTLNYTWMIRAYIEEGGTPPPTPGETDCIGAMIFADGEWEAFVPVPTNTYEYTGNASEVCVRMVYPGTAELPDNNYYYAMSCPECIEIAQACESDITIHGEALTATDQSKIWWGEQPVPGNEWLSYLPIDDEIPVEGTLGAQGIPFYWGCMYPASMIAEQGFTSGVIDQIWYIDVGDPELTGNCEVHIYLGGDNAPQTEITSQTYYIDGEQGLKPIQLDQPVAIDGTQNLWVMFYTDGSIDAPAPMTTYLDDPNTMWMGVQDMWVPLSSFGYTYSFIQFVHVTNGGKGDFLMMNDGTSTHFTNGMTREANLVVKPVSMSSFNATSLRDDNGAPVKYNVYRSTDNANYTLIGEVPYVEGQTYYEYIDTPETSADYYYQVRTVYEDGCESVPALNADDLTQNYVLIPVSVGLNEQSDDVALFPNPTKGNVTIQASGMNHITVVSILGQVVFDTEVNADEYTLNMAQFNKGMYMVRVNTANGMAVKRVTVMQ